VFKLTQRAVADALERLAETVEQLSVVDQAGLLQLMVSGEPMAVGEALLDRYYQGAAGRRFRLNSAAARKMRQPSLVAADTAELEELERRIAAATDPLERLELIQRRIDLREGVA
jgi:hypothetical protein